MGAWAKKRLASVLGGEHLIGQLIFPFACYEIIFFYGNGHTMPNYNPRYNFSKGVFQSN